MKKQRTIISILAVIAIAIVIAVSWRTITLLNSIDTGGDSVPTDKPQLQSEDKNTPVDKDTFGDPKIDQELNRKAEEIDNEAAALMESDPARAKSKYLEAAEAYRQAGNVSKASEMSADATTAELLVAEQKSEQ